MEVCWTRGKYTNLPQFAATLTTWDLDADGRLETSFPPSICLKTVGLIVVLADDGVDLAIASISDANGLVRHESHHLMKIALEKGYQMDQYVGMYRLKAPK